MVATKWAELLQSYMDLRGLSQRALARELEVSSGIVSQWMTGTLPEHRSALKVARRTGLPERQVLEAAELSTASATETSTYPEFLTELLDLLTPAEIAVVAQQARGLLQLRGVIPTSLEPERRRGRPRKEQPEQPPASRLG